MTTNRDTWLPALLRTFAVLEFIYFSLSHWFAPALFFTTLGIDPNAVASPFVRSQLQLIGAMVMGYSLTFLVVATDPFKYRDFLKISILVGIFAIGIFAMHVAAGTLPKLFAVNALMLSMQVGLVVWLFPKRPFH
jgi:hypothetical protein